MAKQVKICDSIHFVDVAVTPIVKPNYTKESREAARECSSDKRQRLNDKHSVLYFSRVMAANFSPNDWVVTLTYSDVALPATSEYAIKKKLKPFISKVRKELRGLSPPFEFPYIYVVEGYHGDGRLHHHMIIRDAPGIRRIIEDSWAKNGTILSFDRISQKGYDGWATYLTKEPRKTGRRRVGQRAWTPSLGLVRPKFVTFDVPDNYRYVPPEWAVAVNSLNIENALFSGEYITFERPIDKIGCPVIAEKYNIASNY